MVTEPQYLHWVLLFAFRCFCYFCSRKGKVASEPRRNYGLDGREYWTNDFRRPHKPLRSGKHTCHCPANPFQLFHYKQKQLLDRIQYIHPLNYVCELGGIRSKFVQVGTNAIRRAILDHPTHFWQYLTNPTKKYYAWARYNWFASLAIRA